MKKNSFLFLMAAVLFSLVFLAGCSKQTEVEGNQEQDISNPVAVDFSFSVKNGMLSFPSTSDYKKAIDFLAKDEENKFSSWDKLTEGFVSERILYEQGAKNDVFVDDEILASLLNENGEIEIAEKIYKVLNNTETVEVIDPVLKTKKLYTFDDDVLYPSDEAKKSGCKRYSAFYGSDTYNKYGSAYKKYGVYFTLVAKNNSSRFPVLIEYKYTFESKSGKVGKVESWSTLSDENLANSDYYHVTLRPYSGTRGLSDFKFCLKFYHKNTSWNSFYEYYRNCTGTCNDCCINK